MKPTSPATPSLSAPSPRDIASPVRSRRTADRRGFSLAEVMVAVGIVVILGVMMTQMIIMTMKVTGFNARPMDAAGQARVVLDRIAGDLQAMVLRDDVMVVMKNIASDQVASEDPNEISAERTSPDLLRFLAQVQSPDTDDADATKNRGISILAYRMIRDQKTDKPMLARGARAIYWDRVGRGGSDATSFFGLKGIRKTTSGVDYIPTALPTVDDELCDVMSDGVFRVEIAFQLGKDYRSPGGNLPKGSRYPSGAILSVPPLKEWKTERQSYFTIDLSKIASIVVAVAVLDVQSQKQAKPEEIAALADALSPMPKNPEAPFSQLPLEIWLPEVSQSPPLQAAAAVPLPIRQAVKVYQRFVTFR